MSNNMNFPQFNFTPNGLVSMHQFSSATKVVGNIPHNVTFIPATNTQHYQNNASHIGFPNNIHVTSTIINQNHYHDTHNAVSNQNVTSNSANSTMTVTASTAAQTSWTDCTNRMSNNAPKINLQSFPPQSHSNHSQVVEKTTPKAIMKSIGTMTDFITPLQTRESKISQKLYINNENSIDSSKSSPTESDPYQRSTCSDSCTKICLKRNASAMAEYLGRLKNSVIPPNIEEFLNTHNTKTSLSKKESSYMKKDCDDSSKDTPEIRLSTALDGSLIYCCSECQMAYSQKELLERHISVHKTERKFECNVCGIFLKRKEHLDQHKQGHSEDRPFVCEICSKGFKRNEHLRRHIVIHSGDKNHVCSQCGKAFSRKDHLNKHLQTHTNKQGKQETSESTSPLLQMQTLSHKT